MLIKQVLGVEIYPYLGSIIFPTRLGLGGGVGYGCHDEYIQLYDL